MDRAFGATKGARHFLLHFDHAKISLGEVVVKRHTQVLQEEQEGVLMFAQPVQQIPGGMLFAFAAFAFWGRGAWMRLIPFGEQSQEAGLPYGHFFLGETRLASRTSLIGGLLH